MKLGHVLRTILDGVERKPDAKLHGKMPCIGAILRIKRTVENRAAYLIEREARFTRCQKRIDRAKKPGAELEIETRSNGTPENKSMKSCFLHRGNALRSYSFARQRVIRIEQRLRRRIADDVNTGLAVLEKISDLLVKTAAHLLRRKVPAVSTPPRHADLRARRG